MSGPDLTPPPDRELPAIEQRRDSLVRELRAPRPSRLRRRHVLLVPAGLLATAGAAWAAGVFDGPVKDISAVVCKSAAQRGAKSVTLPSDISGTLPASATDVCLAEPTIARGLGYVRGGGLRALVSCRGERRAVVVPGPDAERACGRLDLEPLSAKAFRDEVRRQVRAYRLAASLFVDPEESQQGRMIGPDEGPDCVLTGSLRRRVEQRLRARGFEDFNVRLGAGTRSSDCAADISGSVESDGRTIVIASDAAGDSPARELARDATSRAACRRLKRVRRLDSTAEVAVQVAVECIDAELLAQRGYGLRPAEVRAAVRDRLGLAAWRTVVTVPPGRGVTQFGYTSVDRRKRTIEIGFELRRIVAPGAQRRPSG